LPPQVTKAPSIMATAKLYFVTLCFHIVSLQITLVFVLMYRTIVQATCEIYYKKWLWLLQRFTGCARPGSA
jgi:hypothetical protein